MTTRLLYPIPEARELLGGISHTTFYQLVGQGKIRLTKIGRRSFVTPVELQRCADDHQEDGRQTAASEAEV